MVPGAKRSSPGKTAEPLSSADERNGLMKPPRRKQPKEPAYLLADAMRHVREAILITTADLDPPGPEIVYVNEDFCQMAGYTREELIGKTPRIMQGPKTDRSELDRLRRQLSLGKPFDGQIVNYRKDGSEYVIEWYIVPLRNDAGAITHWMASQRDVTDRKVLEEKLRYQALHDSLTNLPNRVQFMDRLEHALALADRAPRLSAVLFVDLDDFKVINDSLGHEAGDDLLVQVAERLRTNLRSEDTVARFGGGRVRHPARRRRGTKSRNRRRRADHRDTARTLHFGRARAENYLQHRNRFDRFLSGPGQRAAKKGRPRHVPSQGEG